VMVFDGQVRSGSCTGGKGRYLVEGSCNMVLSLAFLRIHYPFPPTGSEGLTAAVVTRPKLEAYPRL